jgi:hypothetical protein
MLSIANLENEYNEMNTRNRYPKVQNKQGERCLAISTLGRWTLDSYTWPRLLKWLEPLAKYGMIMSPTPNENQGQLHFTLQQCRPLSKDISAVRTLEFQTLLNSLAGIEITYRGIALTPTGIILKGFPKNEDQYSKIIYTREMLPNIFTESGEQYIEPYKNTICHSTVFRWSREPTKEILNYVLDGIMRWSEAKLAIIRPHIWLFGYLTLEVKLQDCIILKTYFTPQRIAHRGLLDGPNTSLENCPDTIETNVKNKRVSECDVWFENGRYYLGHDKPVYIIEWEWIIEKKDYLLIHAKNCFTFNEMKRRNDTEAIGLDIFYHTDEEIILTTMGKCIVYPGVNVLDDCMSMMPEMALHIDRSRAGYICSDFERI